MRYSEDGGNTWVNIELNTGSYESSAICNEIQRLMAKNGDYDQNANSPNFIIITANLSELKSIVHFSNDSNKIVLSVPNSIRNVLGSTNVIIGFGYNESPNIVNIIQVNSILVNLDITSGSYVNGSASPSIYSFYPNVSPGYKIVEKPSSSLVFYPVLRKEINSQRAWLADQNNDSIDSRGEQITVRICIREVRNVKRDIVCAMKTLKQDNVL